MELFNREEKFFFDKIKEFFYVENTFSSVSNVKNAKKSKNGEVPEAIFKIFIMVWNC